METTALHFPLIEKEEILDLHFGHDDVLLEKEAQKRRSADLERAARLGNAYHGKIELTFQVANGDVLRVRTTIWQVDADYVTLKSGITVPLKAVLGVEFF